MTFCQVPIIASTTQSKAKQSKAKQSKASLEIVLTDGTIEVQLGLTVGREHSAKVFARTGEIARIHAYVPHHSLKSSKSN